TVYNLACLYVDVGKYAQAEPLYQRCLDIFKANPPDDELLADALNGLANVFFEMGQYTKAESAYRRSLTVEEANLGPNHSKVAYRLANLANLCVAMGQYAQ